MKAWHRPLGDFTPSRFAWLLDDVLPGLSRTWNPPEQVASPVGKA